MSETLKTINEEIDKVMAEMEKCQELNTVAEVSHCTQLGQQLSALLRTRNAEEQRMNKEKHQADEDTLKAEADAKVSAKADTEDIPAGE